MTQIVLFLLTFLTTTIAGMSWVTGSIIPGSIENIMIGLPYSLSLIFVLGCHEFGHYFAAKYHKVEASLPYFIPFPFLFGTMGAVIRTKSPILENKAMFDIGVYGPIAGFIASVSLLIYGYINLPGVEYILSIHNNYFSSDFGYGSDTLKFGETIFIIILKYLCTNSSQFVPPMTEIYHYPYLCAGWFGLFVTAMNMIPVSQLDGGHIVYSMFGESIHRKVGYISILILIVLGTVGFLDYYVWEGALKFGWTGWLFWAMIVFFIIKVKHPPVGTFQKLDLKRKILGYLSFTILLLSFSPTPILLKISGF